MLIDRTVVSKMVETTGPQERLTVLVKKGQLACCPDAVYDRINPLHAIHVGISVQTDILFYGMIKAHAMRIDRIPNDLFDRWFPVSLGDFELVTEEWTRRSGLIGDQFGYYLDVLKTQEYLRVILREGKIILVWTPKSVFAILQAVGLKPDINYITIG